MIGPDGEADHIRHKRQRARSDTFTALKEAFYRQTARNITSLFATATWIQRVRCGWSIRNLCSAFSLSLNILDSQGPGLLCDLLPRQEQHDIIV